MRDLFSRTTFIFNFLEVTDITTGVINPPSYGEEMYFSEIYAAIFNRHIKCILYFRFSLFLSKGRLSVNGLLLFRYLDGR